MYEADKTGIILIDPYNDFISEGGKLWDKVKPVADEVNFLSNLSQIITKARETKMQIFFVPHHRWEPGDYSTWKYPTPYQLQSGQFQVFAKGTLYAHEITITSELLKQMEQVGVGF